MTLTTEVQEEVRRLFQDGRFDIDRLDALEPEFRPVVYSKLKDSDRMAVAEMMEVEVGSWAMRDFKDKSELEQLAAALPDLAITVFKGTALVLCGIYPGAGLRPRSDIDVLIDADSFELFAAKLQSMGYEFSPSPGSLVSAARNASRSDDEGFIHRLDCHIRISSAHHPFTRQFYGQALLERLEPVPGMPGNVMTLHPRDALHLACFHRAQHFSHAGDKLIWLYDIHLLVECLTPDDIQLLLAEAREVESLSLVLDGLRCSQSLFGTRVEGLNAQPESVDDLSVALLRPGRHQGIAVRFFSNLVQIQGFFNRLRFVFQNLAPPADYMAHEFNVSGWQLPLAYLKRWALGIRLVVQPLVSRLSTVKGS